MMSADPAASILVRASCLREQRVVDPSILFTFWPRPPLPRQPGAGRKLQLQPSSNLRPGAGEQPRKLHFLLGPAGRGV